MNNVENSAENANKLTTDAKKSSVIKSRVIREKRTRIPLTEQKRLVNVKKDPDYHYFLANDTGDRIASLRLAGYELVDRDGNEIAERDDRMQDPSWRQSALSQPVGGGITGYMMRIPKEWHEEDQRKQREQNDILAKSKKIAVSNGVTESNFYGDIKIEHK